MTCVIRVEDHETGATYCFEESTGVRNFRALREDDSNEIRVIFNDRCIAVIENCSADFEVSLEVLDNE